MNLSGVMRRRLLFGIAVFCVAVITTVGVLSTGDKKEEDTPESLVDLNEQVPPEGDDTQVAEDPLPEQPKEPEQVVQQPEPSVEPEIGEEVAEVPEQPKEPEQVAGTQGTGKGNPPDAQQVAEKEPEQPEEKDNEEQVLSPQLIAEQLNFDKATGLLWPIQGDVIIPYSPDHGVYFSTLDQFKTSDAVVLSAEVGTQVKAAAKGVITSIEEDVRTGVTVTLALGNDTTLVYGQLDVADIEEGDVLEAGACLGTVAEPTRYYTMEGPNLYFRVMEGEASLNPVLLLTE